MAQLSPRLTQYIKRVEVETFALNRLPTLYASSQEGWLHQHQRARTEYQGQIKIAVRQALAAVQRDPLRSSTPLFQDPEEVLVDGSTRNTEQPVHPFYWRQGRYYRPAQKARIT